jgi:hypothetical protein
MTRPSLDAPRLQRLSREQCFRLLSSTPIGRLGINSVVGPLIQPVNFIVLHERIVFRTVPSTKLEAALASASVAFEADGYAPDGAWGWTVLVRGIAEEIAQGPDLESLRVGLLRSWAFPGANRIVGIQPDEVSGRGFGHAVRAMLSAVESG